MATKLDDERDDFVTIGTSLPQYEEDELISRKPIAVHEQVVRDAQGRIRFHGAFTGGFSAGYYNTVDTKEGWAPKTFKSSKLERYKVDNVQKPEDFMDEEDFGEFGIAPRKLATKDKYKNLIDNKGLNKLFPNENIDNLSLFTNSHLMDFLKPARPTIGLKLLKKLGWRHGSGVGIRSNKRKRDTNSGSSQRLYGCALPPEFMALKNRSYDEDDDDDEDNNDALSPEDISPVSFTIKCNLHGLGYSGIDASDVLITKDKLIEVSKKTDGPRKKIKGIKGQAFGVGALEDEDEDIYMGDNLYNYDLSIPVVGDVGEEGGDRLHGWTAPKHADQNASLIKDQQVLPGFKPSSMPHLPPTSYPLPTIPPGFKPFHNANYLVMNRAMKLEGEVGDVVSEVGGMEAWHGKKSCFQRGQLLGETPHLNSIFELVSPKDKARIEAAKMNIELMKKKMMMLKKKEDGVDDNDDNDGGGENDNADSIKVTEVIKGGDKGESDDTRIMEDVHHQMSSPQLINNISRLNNENLHMTKMTTTNNLQTNNNIQATNNIQTNSNIQNTNNIQTINSNNNTIDSNFNNSHNIAKPDDMNQVNRSAFKPFARDPEKQRRYELFTQTFGHASDKTNTSTASNTSDPSNHRNAGMTEWEMEHEREEFKQAFKLFRPMSSMIANRFVSATRSDDAGDDEGGGRDPPDNDSKVKKSDKEEAVARKMFGRLTRECSNWHPTKLLCVRFNVEDPYPDSTIVGLPVSKRAKHSIFNFLQQNFTTGNSAADSSDEKMKIGKKNEAGDKNMDDKKDSSLKPSASIIKPLAILSKIDLRVLASSSSPPPLSSSSTIHLIPADDAIFQKQQLPMQQQLQQLTTDENNVTAGREDEVDGDEKEPERPGIDLFKAIFEDDDDDEEEEEKDEETKHDETSNKVSPKQIANTSPNFQSLNENPWNNMVDNYNKVDNVSNNNNIINSANDNQQLPHPTNLFTASPHYNDNKVTVATTNTAIVQPGSIVSTTLSSVCSALHHHRHRESLDGNSKPHKRHRRSPENIDRRMKHKKDKKHKHSDKHKKHKKSKKSKKKRLKKDENSDDDDNLSEEDDDKQKPSKKDVKLFSKLMKLSSRI